MSSTNAVHPAASAASPGTGGPKAAIASHGSGHHHASSSSSANRPHHDPAHTSYEPTQEPEGLMAWLAVNWRLARSFLCTLYILTGAGVIYLFSSYATQLRDRLGCSQLQLSQLASSGNLGLYLAGPFMGFFIDRYGPRPIAVLSTLLMFASFAAVRHAYAAAPDTISPDSAPATPPGVLALFYVFLGIGSSGVTLSSVALNVRSFPAAIRGFAVGVPVSFYGLSAFVFVQIKRKWFESADEPVVGMLGFLTAITAFLGVGFVIAALAMWEVPRTDVEEVSEAEAAVLVDDEETVVGGTVADESTVVPTARGLGEYLRQIRSWVLFAVFFLAAGTGLMVIGNIGAVVLALSPRGARSTDPLVQARQGTQVAVLSLFNAAGRVVSGMGSDRTGPATRPWWLLGSLSVMTLASLFITSGALPSSGSDASWELPLAVTTAVIGYAYGTLWSLCPAIVAEWIAPAKFGSVWGFMTCVPALSQQVTNTVFGALYDSHRGADGGECHGTECFRAAYVVTAAMCVVGAGCALVLALGWVPGSRLGGTTRYVPVADEDELSAAASSGRSAGATAATQRVPAPFVTSENGDRSPLLEPPRPV
ncbi:hypothetical protein H9P43_001789 [Blastocladiella emersonii ATCC 22665]|nr:hypothetical protein H9P43_001789 [Blastocladiella emersonii ATCC 22665]